MSPSPVGIKGSLLGNPGLVVSGVPNDGHSAYGNGLGTVYNRGGVAGAPPSHHHPHTGLPFALSGAGWGHRPSLAYPAFLPSRLTAAASTW